MKNDDLLCRIVSDKEILAGKPVIKGTRLSVDYILNLLANDMTKQEIIEEYPGLGKEDILACLLFAKQSLESVAFFPTYKVS